MTLFTQMSGTENSFIVADLRELSQQQEFATAFADWPRADFARQACLRHKVDGFVFLDPADGGHQFHWDFYNADGSHAEMCGNAARCVVLYAHKSVNKPVCFSTGAGVICGEVNDDGEVEVEMTKVQGAKLDQQINLAGLGTISYAFVNSGVPHVVVEQKQKLEPSGLKPLALQLRGSKVFQPQGTNVTFYRSVDGHTIEAVTFERGVEDFTKACGTGAVAAAYVYVQIHERDATLVNVLVPGGKLKIDLAHDKPHLLGPAKEVKKITAAEMADSFRS